MRWRLFRKTRHGWSLTGVFSSARQAIRHRDQWPELADTTPIRITIQQFRHALDICARRKT